MCWPALKDLPDNASVNPDELRDALEQLATMRDDLRRTETLLQQKKAPSTSNNAR